MKSTSLYILAFVLVFITIACNETKEPKTTTHVEKEITERISQEISKENLALEAHFAEILSPISSMKISDPDIYWFIVSWMGTNYGTPNWEGYSQKDWKTKAKQKGIDCSGFSRVMLDQLFDKKIRGGSQGILNAYCDRINKKNLSLGDLVFFRAPYSTNDRIVHVGVYLQEGYFVHATSKKSAAEGLGINISHLEEPNWARDYVTGGRVK